jgi:hypothetical protein
VTPYIALALAALSLTACESASQSRLDDASSESPHKPSTDAGGDAPGPRSADDGGEGITDAGSARDAAAGPDASSDDGGRAMPPLPIDYGDLDRTRMPVEDWKETTWVDPGGWVTIDVTAHGLPANDTSVDAALKVADILTSTSGRRRLYFPEGVYSFKSSLTVQTSDLWFDGDGADKTVWRIDAPGSDNAQLVFSGKAESSAVQVAGDLSAGDSAVTVADASGFAVGDLVQLLADDAPLAQGGRAWSLEVHAQMLRVTAIAGNTLTFDMKVLLPYPASSRPMLRRHEALRHFRLSSLKVERTHEPSSENVSNIVVRYSDNALVHAIESSFSGRNHVHFEGAKDCVVTNNYVHDCWKPRTGGYGYGLSLVTSTGCLISNNKTSRLRHQIILQTGANHNVVSYNDVEAPTHYNDIALHATYAYFNLFEGNVFTEGYSDKSKDGQAVEAQTGPGNMWFRNFAVGTVGNLQGSTTRQNVIANLLGRVASDGAQHYIGANLTVSSGAAEWAAVPEGAALPPSLYAREKPAFFTAQDPWPSFGPDLPQWGLHHHIPAQRVRPERSSEPVDDPSFESGSFGAWAASGAVFSIQAGGQRGGAHALYLSGDGAWSNVQQTVRVARNRRYTWRLWGQSSGSGGRLKVIAGSVDLCVLSTRTSSSPSPYAWEPYYCHFDSGSHDTVRLYIGDGGGTHTFDDVQLF